MILLMENKWIAFILRDLKKELVLLSLILTSQELLSPCSEEAWY